MLIAGIWQSITLMPPGPSAPPQQQSCYNASTGDWCHPVRQILLLPKLLRSHFQAPLLPLPREEQQAGQATDSTSRRHALMTNRHIISDILPGPSFYLVVSKAAVFLVSARRSG